MARFVCYKHVNGYKWFLKSYYDRYKQKRFLLENDEGTIFLTKRPKLRHWRLAVKHWLRAGKPMNFNYDNTKGSYE